MELTKKNFEGNGLRLDDTKFISGDWSALQEEPYDYIIGGDIIYNPDNYEKVADVIIRNLKPNGVVIIATKGMYIGNGGRMADFIEVMKKYSFETVKQQINKTGVLRFIMIMKRN